MRRRHPFLIWAMEYEAALAMGCDEFDAIEIAWRELLRREGRAQ
jgi:hypothetical protein